MLMTLAYSDNKQHIVSADALDLINTDIPAIGTDLMVDWLRPQGACLYSTVKGMRVRFNPFNDGFEPEAA